MSASAPARLAAGRISLRINGEPRELSERTSVATLVAELAPEARMVAVERNGEIVPRARWADTMLAPDDLIEIVRFVQGG